MVDKKDDTSGKIVESLDKAIDADVWGASVVLKVILKRLVSIRDRFVKSSNVKNSDVEKKIGGQTLFHDQVRVYVALYVSGGRDITRWERLLRSISNGIQGRPCYRDEVFARNYVNSKGGSESHAYIVVNVEPKYILKVSEDKLSKDALGQKVINVMCRAVDRASIVEFVHKNNKRYRFVDKKLVLIK